MISPNFAAEKIETGKLEDWIDVFEDRIVNWTLRQARSLLKISDNDYDCDHYKEKQFSIAEFVTNWVIPGIIYGCIIFVILSILFYFLRYVFNLFS